MKESNIIKNQKHNQNLWALKCIMYYSFFIDGRLIGVPIRIIILGLEKIKAEFKDLKGIGIYLFSKHISDCLIGNAHKWSHLLQNNL